MASDLPLARLVPMNAESPVAPPFDRAKPRKHAFISVERLRRYRWFFAAVVVPSLIALVYYGLWASDEYVSESAFVIRSPSQRPSQLTTIANLIQTSGFSSNADQAGDVLEYVHSRSALLDLEKRMDVKASFASSAADWIARYPHPFRQDTFENLYKYYNGKIGAAVDKDTGVARLVVRAYSPVDAYRINQNLLLLSEDLVNRLNRRAQSQTIAEGERRVAEAEGRVRKARAALAVYRNQSGLLDPGKQSSGVLDVSNRLVVEQAGLQAQLELMNREAPRNPAIPALRARIAAIAAGVAAQSGRAVGGEHAISNKLSEYEKFAVEQEFASQNLVAASAALEQARVDAQKQQYYLQRVVEPNLPDMALLPQRLWSILTVVGAAICLYFIGWMLVVGILEHAPED